MSDYFGFAYPSADACPDAAARHTRAPRGYLAWHEWATRKQRTHEVKRCPRCGYWAIWVPKTATTERGAA